MPDMVGFGGRFVVGPAAASTLLDSNGPDARVYADWSSSG
jgi:hypothetical protein